MSFSPNNWLSGDIITAAKANNTDTQFDQSVKYTELHRQTVISGAVSSIDGTANFITGSTTALTAFATASTGEPILVSFANGNSTFGGLNYTVNITSDVSWTGLASSNTSFLFLESSTSGAITSSHTIVPPQYGYFFNQTHNSLIHFDGTAGSTTTTDNFGNTWTNFGTAVLSTAQIKFGTASLTLPGSVGSYIETTDITKFTNENGDNKWSQECWFYIDSTAASRPVFASKNLYGFDVRYNVVTGHMNLFLAGSTSAFDIANPSSGTTTVTSSSWHSVAVTYNSSTYTLWLDGVADITVASTVLINTLWGGIRIGLNANSDTPFSGYIDEYRYTAGVARYTNTYTPESSAFTGDVHYFNLNTAKMLYGDPTSWVEKIRVFVGEATTDTTVVTNAITYALKGIYDSGWFSVLAGADTEKSHNLGITMPGHVIYDIYYSLSGDNSDSAPSHDIYINSSAQSIGHFNTSGSTNTRNKIAFGFGNFTQVYKGTNRTNGYYRVVMRRLFF